MTTTVQNQLPEKDSNRQMTPASDNGTNGSEVQKHDDELNAFIIEGINKMRERKREAREKYRREVGDIFSDITHPYCDTRFSPLENIKQVLAVYNNTTMAALASEHQYMIIYRKLEKLTHRIGLERLVIEEFMKKKGLWKELDEYAQKRLNQIKQNMKQGTSETTDGYFLEPNIQLHEDD